MLAPEIARAASFELDPLRAACDAVVRRLLAAELDWLLVLGAGPRAVRYPATDHGSLAGYGVDLRARLGTGAAAGVPRLPLALTLGGWLLARAGGHRSVVGVQVGPDGELPGEIEAPTGRGGLLVMGDGSARRGPHPPGWPDPRAEPHDAAVAAALAAGDPARLAGLDPALGAELMAAGVPAWRAAGRLLAGARVRAELLHHEAPYGVGYLVAGWNVIDGPGAGG
ncbi:MAG: hypothetical protein HY241_13630 [Actinobacteria bacterium]|nr:hypothetical protein [Actinomycetota bacterium]